jgi:hypothetical protein
VTLSPIYNWRGLKDPVMTEALIHCVFERYQPPGLVVKAWLSCEYKEGDI